MADLPDIGDDQHSSSVSKVVSLRDYKNKLDPLPVTFHRRELDAILRVYGYMVGDGQWRDYAIDHLKDRAVFYVFKRSGDIPLYRIEKVPALASKQGAYSVVNIDGRTLKRGHDLPQVLKVFDKSLRLIE